MKVGHILRTMTLVAAAAVLLMFALAAAPKAPSASAPAVFRVAVAHAEEAAPAAAAEGEAAAGEAAKPEKKEIPHVVGKPSPAQLEDLRRSWTSIPGFDVLLVSILGLVAVVGVVGFGAYKQMKC